MDATKRARAVALLDELLREDASDPLVTELLDRYLDSPEFKALRAWKTERARIGHLRAHLGTLHVSQLNAAAIDDYRLTRASEPGHLRLDGLHKLTSPSTRNREVARLVRILNWALERQLVTGNPIAKCVDEDEPPWRKTRITSEDVDLLRVGAMAHAWRDERTGLVLRAMISTKYDSLLRRSEVCSLRFTQVDFARGLIVLDLVQTKARRDGERIPPLSDRAAADMHAIPTFEGSPWVFTNTWGQRYNPRTFLRMVQRIANEVGVKGADGENFVGHDLRAGGITQQIEIGTPDQETADFAGWSSTAMIGRYHRRDAVAAALRAKDRLERARGNRP